MLDSKDEEMVHRIVTESCADLLASFGVPAHAAAPAERPAVPEHDIAGFIGFTGPVRGSLMIAGSTALFRRTYPAAAGGGAAPTAGDLYDWTAELTNQLLGRIKRRFCERGQDFEASTPTAVRGRDLGLRSAPRNGVSDLMLVDGGETLTMCVEIVPAQDGRIFNDSAEPINCSPEGELVLF